MQDLKLINHQDETKFGQSLMDIDIDETGNPVLLSGNELLLQQVVKCVMTGLQENGYGSRIYNLQGAKMLAYTDNAFIMFELTRSLKVLQTLIAKNALVQDVADSEKLYELPYIFTNYVRATGYWEITAKLKDYSGNNLTTTVIAGT